ncbi:MAG: ACP S-malonyltransferase [Bacteroidales bacterium]|nr:ACP S-malonyltransferase [Bacteroidales bacterium]
MRAYVFPGQGSQFPGMGKELYESNSRARELFSRACEILGFDISAIMFSGSAEDLRATAVTQPAVFLHSVITALCMEDFKPDMTAGHSLGEFSALVAAGALEFEDALRLVAVRADAMQKACEAVPGTMAAVLGMDFKTIEDICAGIDGVVVPANYNSPGQLVISGENDAIDRACAALKEAGAKRALKLSVGGAFHSPLMAPAAERLAKAIEDTAFKTPLCPVYQNVDALPATDSEQIKGNLLKQLTSPVRWAQTVENMIADGATSFTEVGPGTVLAGLIKKIAPEGAIEIESVG